MKTETQIVKQRPLLVYGQPGYVEGKRLLDRNAEPVEIGSFPAIEECTMDELLASIQEEYGCDEDEAAERLVNLARQQFNTDRRNAIAADHVNGGTKQAKVDSVALLTAVLADPNASAEMKAAANAKIMAIVLGKK